MSKQLSRRAFLGASLTIAGSAALPRFALAQQPTARTLVAERCADLLTVVAHAIQLAGGPESSKDRIRLLSSNESAAWAAPAASLAGPTISRAVLATNGFRYADAGGYQAPLFVPGAVKYGDLPAVLALRSPHPTMILGEPETPDLTKRAFEAVAAGGNLGFSGSNTVSNATLEWLCE